jgi:hypothetical protein
MVIFPVLFRPPDLEAPFTKDFSGVEVVTISNVLATLCLCPGVIGFNFLTAMVYQILL